MYFSKRTLIRIIMVAAIVMITAVIFIKSFENFSTSHNHSDAIAEVLLSDDDDYIKKGNIEVAVRKVAHLVEYAVLGFAVMSLIVHLKHTCKKCFLGSGFFYVLAIAVLDEYIQSFSGRSSSTSDIVLDFAGVLIGFTIAVIIFWIVYAINRHKSINKNEV